MQYSRDRAPLPRPFTSTTSVNVETHLCDGSTFITTAREIGALRGASALSAGYRHAVALRPDGTVWTCGGNSSGQLGDGTRLNRTTPVQVVGVSGAAAVTAGFQHSGAVISDGTVRTWGSNSTGQLGDRTTDSKSSPIQGGGTSLIDDAQFFARQHYNFEGYNFRLQKLDDSGGDFRRAEMVRAFIESIEYADRFR